MMTESCEESLSDLIETQFPDVNDEVYMRSIYLARLLDETEDIEELKVVVMSQLVAISVAIASLDHSIGLIHDFLERQFA